MAVLEMTRRDGNKGGPPPPPTYFKAIEARITQRDGQGKAVRSLAKALSVPLYYVVFNNWCDQFWVADESFADWQWYSKHNYEDWLRGLKPVSNWSLPMNEVAEVIWSSVNAVIYRDIHGKTWRYLASYNAEWPVIIE